MKQKINDFIAGKYGVILEDKRASIEFLKLCADRNLRWADGRVANHQERMPKTPCIVEYYNGSLSVGRCAFYSKMSVEFNKFFKGSNAEILVNRPDNIVLKINGQIYELTINENTKLWMLTEFRRN